MEMIVSTSVVGIVLLSAVVFAVRSMMRDKRKGKSLQCGGECSHCGLQCSHCGVQYSHCGGKCCQVPKDNRR